MASDLTDIDYAALAEFRFALRRFQMFSETKAGEAGLTPQILIKSGKPVEVVRELIAASDEIAALVLATAPSGAPGPLVTHFTGQDAGTLPCPVMLVPGGIDITRLDALS